VIEIGKFQIMFILAKDEELVKSKFPPPLANPKWAGISDFFMGRKLLF